MKKINKVFISTILILILVFAVKVDVTKAVSTTLSASNATVKSGESFSVKVSSSIKLSGWTISLTNSDKCTLSSASGGEVSGGKVYGTSIDGTTSLATFNFKAPEVTKDTTYTITFSGTEMCDASNAADVNNTTCSAKITVKAKTTSNSGSGSGSGSSSSGSSSSSGNTTSKKPNFTTVNKKVYTTNDVRLRSSWSTSSSAVLVSAGTELTLTGTSKEIVNDYIWYRVTYKGATKYVASNFVSETKPEDVDYPENIKSSNNNLSSLTIEGLTLEPSFNSDVLDYTTNLEEDLDKLTVTTKTENSKATAKVEGNEGLKTGENTIKITVAAEDGTKKTYTVKVTKTSSTNTPDTTQTTDDGKLKLKTLEISGVNFSDGFNPDQYSYELSLNFVVKELNITAVANREDATIEILGNNDFKEGENLVTILVKSASEEETASYQIKVTLPRGVVQKQGNIEFYIKCVVIAFAVLLVVLIITLISKKAKKRNDYADIEEETIPTANINKESRKADDSMEDEDSNADFLDNIEITKKPKRSKGKHSV